MHKVIGFIIVLCSFCGSMHAQSFVVTGRVINIYSSEPIRGAEVSIRNTELTSETDEFGEFRIGYSEANLGEHTLVIEAEGYMKKNLRLLLESDKTLNIDPILMNPDFSISESEISVIGLSDYELDEAGEVASNYSGLLEASRDVFLNAVAYDFSATFFKPRGMDNRNAELLINGVSTNKFYDGRPQWGGLGGLNDVQRIREFSRNSTNIDIDFGGMAGTNNIVMRATAYPRGGKASYARANRSYQNRLMSSYHSGLTPSGWSYALLASRRSGERGFIEGTPYEGNSFFLSVEKSLGKEHKVNLSAFYTAVERGRGTALTREVEKLKGPAYNPHWGFQQGRIRNSRLRRTEQPLLMLNHSWMVSDSFELNTNIAYQFGEIGNTRLDNAGIRNPAPNYYQRLPSYFLRNSELSNYAFRLAYEAEQKFINDGQLDWESFYRINSSTNDGLSRIVLQEDVRNDKLFVFNSIGSVRISQRITLNSKIEFRSLISENFARIEDLLGGSGFRDIDYFGKDPNQIQSDLDNPEHIVTNEDRYKYNYLLKASKLDGFTQVQLRFNRLRFYTAIRAFQTNFERQGLYRNGYFPEQNRSLGSSERISFLSFSGKIGGTYSIKNRHFADGNIAFTTRPPLLRNAFANPRQNNDVVDGLTSEKVLQADLSYLYRSTVLDARITGYYSTLTNQTEIGFFFTQNALGSDDNNAFVQEIVSGISHQNVGVEVGIEAQLITTLKLKFAASIGQSIYTNNPSLYLSGDDFDQDRNDEFVEGNDLSTLGKRKVYLKNYRVSGGPQKAYQIGFEFRDPTYWWLGGTLNYFTDTYVDISYLRRTTDFFTDKDGLPFNDFDEEIARFLLQQEKLENYFLVNLVGGKTWRIKRYTVGFFASVNNLLNTKYRSGGFEDSRRVSYRQRLEEVNRPFGPLFGNRYFYGTGTTYFMNIYLRF